MKNFILCLTILTIVLAGCVSAAPATGDAGVIGEIYSRENSTTMRKSVLTKATLLSYESTLKT